MLGGCYTGITAQIRAAISLLSVGPLLTTNLRASTQVAVFAIIAEPAAISLEGEVGAGLAFPFGVQERFVLSLSVQEGLGAERPALDQLWAGLLARWHFDFRVHRVVEVHKGVLFRHDSVQARAGTNQQLGIGTESNHGA